MSVPRNARLALADIDETALTNSKTDLSHVTAVGTYLSAVVYRLFPDKAIRLPSGACPDKAPVRAGASW
jgi:hypothetical protein